MSAASRQQFLEAPGLQVRFSLTGDRYAHEIWLADGADWVRVLTSVEGSPADDWPASPPLQSLDVAVLDGGKPAALLLGMAGHSHWSASIIVDPGARSVHFDVACRVRGEIFGRLGSSYRADGPIAVGDASRATVSVAQAILQIDACRKFGQTQLTSNGNILHAAIHQELSAGEAHTLRWGYTMRVAASGD